MDVNILILNYNGEKLLPECLPSVIRAAKTSSYNTIVSVIDNVSTDSSLEILSAFKGIQVYPMKQNKFLLSYNEILKQVKEEIVILLNNDIKVDENFVDPLVIPFETQGDLFFTAPRTLSFDGNKYEGNLTKIEFRYGFFKTDSFFPGYQDKNKKDGYTIMTGFGAFRRKIFLALGGYESLYYPGRWEDLDICYNAWKTGLKGLYVNSSVVYHIGAACFNETFGTGGTFLLAQRNHFLFIWKNLKDTPLIFLHLFFLVPRLFFAFFRGNRSFVHGFFKAVPHVFGALSRRLGAPDPNFSDKYILNVFKNMRQSTTPAVNKYEYK